MTKARIMVFGETGIGKTSLCNALSGRSRPTDGGAKGVTAKSHQYAAFGFGDRKIELIDTVGLHEGDGGTVPAERAVLQLVELLERAKDGFSLLVHVTRASRITKDFEDDHKFFVEKMTQRKIPVLLVVTGCENEAPMQTWVDRNRSSFTKFGYHEIVASCFAEGGPLESHYEPLRRQSREIVLQAIVRLALNEPTLLYGGTTGNSFNEVLTKVWNSFVDIAGLPEKYRRQLNETAFSLMKRVGVPDALAKMAIKHIPDLAEELGNKIPVPLFGKIVRKISETVLHSFSRKKQ